MHDPFSEQSQAYRFNGDYELLTSLGLRTWNFPREWLDIGTVTTGDPDSQDPATIKVEVSAMPAQFWRFTITQESRVTVLETGSGAFSKYWPVAQMVAGGMLHFVKEAE